MLQVVFTIIKCNSRLKSNGKLLQEDAIEATDMDLGKSYTFWGAAFAKKDLCIIPVDETVTPSISHCFLRAWPAILVNSFHLTSVGFNWF